MSSPSRRPPSPMPRKTSAIAASGMLAWRTGMTNQSGMARIRFDMGQLFGGTGRACVILLGGCVLAVHGTCRPVPGTAWHVPCTMHRPPLLSRQTCVCPRNSRHSSYEFRRRRVDSHHQGLERKRPQGRRCRRCHQGS